MENAHMPHQNLHAFCDEQPLSLAASVPLCGPVHITGSVLVSLLLHGIAAPRRGLVSMLGAGWPRPHFRSAEPGTVISHANLPSAYDMGE